MSGVGAGGQVLDIELPSKPGVEGADAFLELLPKRGEVFDVTIEFPAIRGWSAAGDRFAFRRRSDRPFFPRRPAGRAATF